MNEHAKHRKWKCPGCKEKITTLPLTRPPEHQCNPAAKSTHKVFIPND